MQMPDDLIESYSKNSKFSESKSIFAVLPLASCIQLLSRAW